MIPTPEQTLGPFFLPRFVDADANDLTQLEGRRARGEPIEIHGVVTEEGGAPLENLIVEIWQADAAGIFRHPLDPRHREADPDFLGWGRAATDREGRYLFRTIRPGAPAGRAPHINLMLMYSGLMRILKTALFFEDGPGNDADPVLRCVPPERRGLLVARREAPGRYRFDIRLRGEGETPFFDD
ncbi:MAG: protocatechuate 3,4-dioxygenase subunit alpha [Burkholderiales bacterium]|nr:protocatechuate 3,4-dioxygenase subunit alpha [Burkholderiales bacterium]